VTNKNIHRKSILCPNCRKLIDVDESRYPYCHTAHPGSWLKNNFWTRGFRSPRQLIKLIIYVNIGLYVFALFLNPRLSGISLNPIAFLTPENKSLLVLGGTGTIPIGRFHWWWTLVSANYLHGSILHIFFNMFAFRQLAPLAIQEYGPYRMFTLYTIGGVFGFWISYLAGVRFTIGASAALFSLIGAMIYYGKSRGGTYGNTIYKQIGGWAIGLFIFGLIMPGINNWGHGGGLAAGLILGLILKYQEKKREGVYHKLLSGFCLLLTGVILCWAILSGIIYRFF